MMYRCYLLLALACLYCSGCALIPEISHEPQYHNPFPQLHRVAVLPFYNQSTEPTLDQQKVAAAYANELQQIPGFEVVPVGVTVRALEGVKINPASADDLRKLCKLLGVDAVVVGAVTDFSPYYPPRMAMTVRWYAANPGFHEIPPGYGLPWGTPEEEYIPDALVRETEFHLAREQLKTQAPVSPADIGELPGRKLERSFQDASMSSKDQNEVITTSSGTDVQPAAGSHALTAGASDTRDTTIITGPPVATNSPVPSAISPTAPAAPLPPDWPDPRGLIPAAPRAARPPLLPHDGPVMTHTKAYNGHDADFTAALESYYYFRDDARFGGWQSYLTRSDDFIRFCCYLHITEMLSARGGAGKTRVVYRWTTSR